MVRPVQRKKTLLIRKIFFVILALSIFLGIKTLRHSPPSKIDPNLRSDPSVQLAPSSPSPQLAQKGLKKHTAYNGTLGIHLFVPYWRLSESYAPPTISQSDLTTLMYFAIHPLPDGTLDRSEPGYTHLPTFMAQTQNLDSAHLLTVSMQNEDISSPILESPILQRKLAEEVSLTAHTYGFDGIVLDLEYAALPTTEVVSQISTFTQTFSDIAHTNGLTFSITLYGDTYYRSRPYDVKTLATSVDFVYIMAYDFHKSYGQPGPNFPLSTTSQNGTSYPYSLEVALEDFLSDVPKEKLIVTYGLFGYDWMVDDQNRPAKQAQARTLSQFTSQFKPECTELHCTVTRDQSSQETSVSFTDSSGQKHSMWFEDFQSMTSKIKRARSFGISNAGIWAYGYY